MADAHFHLFTYGTLKRGMSGRSLPLTHECEPVGPATVRGTLYDAGAYPALLLAGDDVVRGEVWRCPAELLARLDRYEGTREGLFRRAAVKAGDIVCWTYVAGPKLGPRLLPEARIESGEWTR